MVIQEISQLTNSVSQEVAILLMLETRVGLIARAASLQAVRSLPWWDWDAEQSDVYPGVTSELAKCVDGTGPLTSSIWKVQWCVCQLLPPT